MATENEIEPDNLLADVGAAFDALPVEEAPIAAPDDTAAPPIDETDKPGRARDEGGRFAKGEKLTAKDLKPAEVSPLEGQSEKPDKAITDANKAILDPNKLADEKIAPPLEWKGAGKVKWDRLPREVQGELRDTWQAMATERAELAPLKEILDLNRASLVSQAGSVAEGVRQLFVFENMSRTVDGSIQLAQHILRQRGIDPRALLGGQATQQEQQPQDFNAAVARAVSQHLQPLLAQNEQRETHQTLQTIESFRADPKHPYFNDVVDHMSVLISAAKGAGQKLTLDDAYDQAVWANPATRQAMLTKQTEDAAAAQAEKVAIARRASGASLRGSPLAGVVANGGGQNATVLDDVRAAAASLEG